jgi:hypothetical protein
VALSFLYIAFVRLLQLVRLSWGEQQDLAIEVVMLSAAMRSCTETAK